MPHDAVTEDLFFARAELDKKAVERTVTDALVGCDDGELFLEYRQSESVSLDDGRIKSANFDTEPGLRPALGVGRGDRLCPCGHLVRGRAQARRRNGARGPHRPWRHHGRAARRHQPHSLHRRQSAVADPVRDQGGAAGRDRRLCARQGSARQAGDGLAARIVAGGAHRARRRHPCLRHAAPGAAQRRGHDGRWRTHGNAAATAPAAASPTTGCWSPTPGRRRSTKRSARRWSISIRFPRRPAT